MLIRSILVIAIAVVVSTHARQAYAQSEDSLTLTVIVTGATAGTGQALGALFDSKESYLRAPVQETIGTIDTSGRARLTFEGLEAGTYSVSVIYDEDSDGELDTGFLGIPTELVAMSNNAKGRFGPPSFKKTRFEMHSSMSIEIQFAKAKD